MTLIKQILHYGNTIIVYDVIKSRRVRTSEIIVDENKVIIRTPSNKTLSEIEQLISTKAKWIVDKQKEYRELQRQIVKPTFQSGSTLPYLGKNYRLEVINSIDEHFTFSRGRFLVSTKNFAKSNISNEYHKWLKQKSDMIFPIKVAEYSKKLNKVPRKVVIKNLRNRWGSVTKEGVLNLNLNLLKTPKEVIDYVIVHELCHFIVKQHSHHFWYLIKKYVGDYKSKREWLEINSPHLVSNLNK